METALKQRVVGAIVLVALAVIFLPMLIKGPAPESGVSDVPLDLPDAPKGEFETRELPLVTPGAAPASGIVGMDATAPDEGAADDGQGGMLHAATAGGDYAVSFGRYATAADAGKVVAALRNSQLPGYAEAVEESGRTLHRVRIGPFASQAEAESARLRAAHVNDQVDAQVVVLDAEGGGPQLTDTATQDASATTPSAAAAPDTAAAAAKPATNPATKPETTGTTATPPRAMAQPTQTAAAPTAATPTAAKPAPAAAGTGFAVQLGAFSNAAEAERVRDRARAAGLRAFVESVRTDKGVLSRVRVGPVLTRAEADQLKAQVAAKLGIGDAIVKPHP